jgi:putative endonuclease
MSPERQDLGKEGESVACAYLTRLGYQIIARRWRCRLGELDIIAQEGGEWVFIEVKTRQGRLTPGDALSAITPEKAERLIQLAYTYFSTHEIDSEQVQWRIDVVGVIRRGETYQIDLIRDGLEW